MSIEFFDPKVDEYYLGFRAYESPDEVAAAATAAAEVHDGVRTVAQFFPATEEGDAAAIKWIADTNQSTEVEAVGHYIYYSDSDRPKYVPARYHGREYHVHNAEGIVRDTRSSGGMILKLIAPYPEGSRPFEDAFEAARNQPQTPETN